MADVREVVSDGMRAVEQWLSQLSAGDWVLLALGVAAITWLVTGLRAMTRLGPIEIKPLEEDSESKQPIKGLTAVIARRLHACGLISPSEVPAGAPQADFISAVEASPVPQASWIASILKAAPRPRPAAYALGGTVVKGENGAVGGLGFWVRPVREGSEIQRFVPACAEKLETAATQAADTAYLHIIDDAAYLLPLWARWSSGEAFASYMAAIKSLGDNDDIDGAGRLDGAASREPTNLLIRLQFANLLERTVSAHEDEATRRALKYARALNAYLRVAKLEPTVVEARYRASVLAAMLASCIVTDAGKAPRVPAVSSALPMIKLPSGPPGRDADNGEAAADMLSALSRSESNAVLQLLRPWYTLLRQGRLRHQLEMAGMDRRRLRNTVRISRHCVWFRERKGAIPWYAGPRVLWRWLVVRWLVLRNVGWHGHYNAACFDGLLYQRRKERWRVPGQADVADGWLLRFLKRGSLNHLSIALHDSKGALSWEWVTRDPDLTEVRNESDPDWRIVLERYGGKDASQPTNPQWVDVRARAPHLVGEMAELRGHPERPWGDPARRHYAWSVFAIALDAVVVGLVWFGAAESVRLLTVLAALATLATLRAVLLAGETWRTWSVEPESMGDAATSDTWSYSFRTIAFALGLAAVMYAALAHHFVWQLPFALGLIAVLVIVWAVVAAKQAVRFAHAAAPTPAGVTP